MFSSADLLFLNQLRVRWEKHGPHMSILSNCADRIIQLIN